MMTRRSMSWMEDVLRDMITYAEENGCGALAERLRCVLDDYDFRNDERGVAPTSVIGIAEARF